MLLTNFRDELQELERKSYIQNRNLVGQDFIDCSEGINPYGVAIDLKEVEPLTPYDVSYYPFNDKIFPAIINYWKEQHVELKEENILLTEGSMGGLALLAATMSTDQAKCLGIVPQFPEFISLARFNGLTYEGYHLNSEEKYQFYVEDFLRMIDDDYNLVYVDNPNNPTGQLISLEDIRAILEKAMEKKVHVVVDEAYGDFVGKENSAINLLNEYDNLIVLRTMSKGFGMAGIRGGYMVSSAEAINIMSQLTNPYVTNALTRKYMVLALTRENYLEENAEKISKVKRLLRKMIGDNLTMAVSDDRTPICLLEHRDPNVHLHELLLEKGVLAIGADAFEGLGKNSVRLRIPRQEDLSILLKALMTIDEGK